MTAEPIAPPLRQVPVGCAVMAVWPFALVLLATLALAGCGKPEPVPTPYVQSIERTYARECNSDADPKWKDPPDRAASRSESARLFRENKTRFRSLEKYRAACSASHRAHGQ